MDTSTSQQLFNTAGGFAFILTFLVAITIALVWLIFPFLVLSKLEKIRKDINESARHLAYIRTSNGSSEMHLQKISIDADKVARFTDRYPADPPVQ